MTLNVLVLESDRGTAEDAARDLADAGHVVLRCHDPGAPAFPCRGIVDQSACPLRTHTVDVALDVRSQPRSQPTPEEDGVRCSLMHRVPLVVAGPSVLDPYEAFEAAIVDRAGDVVAACEAVAEAELARHSRVATEALRASRTPHDALADARAVVTRRSGRLRVSLSGLGALAPLQRDAAIVRTLGKLREFDSSAKGIDIVLEPS
jgi:hypothetical protein